MSQTRIIDEKDLPHYLFESLSKLGTPKKVLVIPPDISRLQSRSGYITALLWQYYGNALCDILPALGTHPPMTKNMIHSMFGDIPLSLFRVHRWQDDTICLGRIGQSRVNEISQGALQQSWPVQINNMVAKGGHDIILSVGQVVPHEVVGMSGYTKNIFIGTGGAEAIHTSHYLSALFGIENIMGNLYSPVRTLLNEGARIFASHLPIVYILIVLNSKGGFEGLYLTNTDEGFYQAALLSQKVNITYVEKHISNALVYLDPVKYQSTWLGNKAIYRTRMALAKNATLHIVAPGVTCFAEDSTMDGLIRQFGYQPRERIRQLVASNTNLQNNLAVAAHLLHGYPEGKFTVRYYLGDATGKLDATFSKNTLEGVGYQFDTYSNIRKKYNIEMLCEGWNYPNSDNEVYYIKDPGQGLWKADKVVE